jgi:hypothetical protein
MQIGKRKPQFTGYRVGKPGKWLLYLHDAVWGQPETAIKFRRWISTAIGRRARVSERRTWVKVHNTLFRSYGKRTASVTNRLYKTEGPWEAIKNSLRYNVRRRAREETTRRIRRTRANAYRKGRVSVKYWDNPDNYGNRKVTKKTYALSFFGSYAKRRILRNTARGQWSLEEASRERQAELNRRPAKRSRTGAGVKFKRPAVEHAEAIRIALTSDVKALEKQRRGHGHCLGDSGDSLKGRVGEQTRRARVELVGRKLLLESIGAGYWWDDSEDRYREKGRVKYDAVRQEAEVTWEKAKPLWEKTETYEWEDVIWAYERRRVRCEVASAADTGVLENFLESSPKVYPRGEGDPFRYLFIEWLRTSVRIAELFVQRGPQGERRQREKRGSSSASRQPSASRLIRRVLREFNYEWNFWGDNKNDVVRRHEIERTSVEEDRLQAERNAHRYHVLTRTGRHLRKLRLLTPYWDDHVREYFRKKTKDQRDLGFPWFLEKRWRRYLSTALEKRSTEDFIELEACFRRIGEWEPRLFGRPDRDLGTGVRREGHPNHVRVPRLFQELHRKEGQGSTLGEKRPQELPEDLREYWIRVYKAKREFRRDPVKRRPKSTSAHLDGRRFFVYYHSPRKGEPVKQGKENYGHFRRVRQKWSWYEHPRKYKNPWGYPKVLLPGVSIKNLWKWIGREKLFTREHKYGADRTSYLFSNDQTPLQTERYRSASKQYLNDSYRSRAELKLRNVFWPKGPENWRLQQLAGEERSELVHSRSDLDVWLRLYPAERLEWYPLRDIPAIPYEPEEEEHTNQVKYGVSVGQLQYNLVRPEVPESFGEKPEVRELRARRKHRKKRLRKLWSRWYKGKLRLEIAKIEKQLLKGVPKALAEPEPEAGAREPGDPGEARAVPKAREEVSSGETPPRVDREHDPRVKVQSIKANQAKLREAVLRGDEEQVRILSKEVLRERAELKKVAKGAKWWKEKQRLEALKKAPVDRVREAIDTYRLEKLIAYGVIPADKVYRYQVAKNPYLSRDRLSADKFEERRLESQGDLAKLIARHTRVQDKYRKYTGGYEPTRAEKYKGKFRRISRADFDQGKLDTLLYRPYKPEVEEVPFAFRKGKSNTRRSSEQRREQEEEKRKLGQRPGTLGKWVRRQKRKSQTKPKTKDKPKVKAKGKSQVKSKAKGKSQVKSKAKGKSQVKSKAKAKGKSTGKTKG